VTVPDRSAPTRPPARTHSPPDPLDRVHRLPRLYPRDDAPRISSTAPDLSGPRTRGRHGDVRGRGAAQAQDRQRRARPARRRHPRGPPAAVARAEPRARAADAAAQEGAGVHAAGALRRAAGRGEPPRQGAAGVRNGGGPPRPRAAPAARRLCVRANLSAAAARRGRARRGRRGGRQRRALGVALGVARRRRRRRA